MKKTPLWLLTAIICFFTHFAIAQVNLSNYSTYSLEVIPFQSKYGNTLNEKDIDLTFSNLTRVAEDGDLYIRVNFMDGLKGNYLLQTAIPGTGFAYRVEYRMPIYRVSIVDKNGSLLLQKIYGGEKKKTLYGDGESISSVEDLEYEWETNRDAFYTKLESLPEEIVEQPMDQELVAAIFEKGQATTTATAPNIADNTPPPTSTTEEELEEITEEVADNQEVRKRPPSKNNKKPNINIYRRPDPNRSPTEDPSQPKLSPTAQQIYDLNGLVEIDACSKYSYQIKNKHSFITLTVLLQDNPEKDYQEVVLEPGEVKFFSGVPNKQAWIKTIYQKDFFQEDQILAKEDLNLIATDDNQPRIVTTLLDAFFAEVKPKVIFTPKFDDTTDEVIDYVPENRVWQEQLKSFLAQQQISILTKGQQNKIAKETEKLLTIRALRTISKKIEGNIDSEDQELLVYPIVKASKNFRNITPFISLAYSQSILLNKGINDYWNQTKSHRASISFRLPFEWQLSKRKNNALSTLNVKASYESLTLDFNQAAFQAYATDPLGAFQEPEIVLPEDQFAIQTTQLSAGLAWKLYLPLPIIELEGGAFFSHKTRLLWGQDQGQFPRKIFKPENEIISDVVSLSSFRPYFGAKIAIPFYFSGYKFDCDSNLRNIHAFAGFRMYPVDFSKTDNYDLFVRDPADIDFIPIPLEDGQSKFITHLMVGIGIEF